MAQPRVVVLAGPNGAGKTTCANILLREALAVDEFVNADAIAQGLSAFAPEQVARQAGRLMLDRIADLAEAHRSFAFETTLASRTFLPQLKALEATGYRTTLVFLWLPSPDLAVARVALRVASGGHNVPEADVRRRYERGLRNFFALYRAGREWEFYDASAPGDPRVIAYGAGEVADQVSDPTLWATVVRQWST